MSAPVDGVLAVDGGRQDPTDFTDWDRTAGFRDFAALDLAFAVRFHWSWIERSLDDPETRDNLRRLVDEFSARCAEHDAAVSRMDAARKAAGLP